MNPVFFIGLFAAGALLWLLLSFLYKPVGSVGKRLANDAKRAITEEENKNENKGEGLK
jgi:F0F1-type ATP synthase membrane subunit b/b'